MDRIEMVEKLRERANVGYEEAKKALEQCEWDLLDAMVLLETKGKVKPEGSEHSTKRRKAEGEESTVTGEARRGLDRFFRFVGALCKRATRNSFVLSKGGEAVITMPAIVFIILVLSAFWVTIPLLLVSIFYGHSIGFRGPESKAVDAVAKRISSAVENLSQEVKEEFTEKQERTDVEGQ